MVEALVIALVLAGMFAVYLCYALWKSYQEVGRLNDRIDDLNADLDIEDRRMNTLLAENTSLRGKITALEMTAADEVVRETEINPQHFRPMFDSQGPLFNTEVEAIAVEPIIEEESIDTENSDRSGSVQGGEETSNWLLRSE